MANLRSSHKRKMWMAIAFSFGVAFLLATCNALPEDPIPQCPDAECPVVVCPEPPRYEDLWASSAHADQNAAAFRNWDTDDPPEIPVDCAKCHSKTGFIDFLGVDGSTIEKVDNPASPGTTIACFACHNEAIDDLASVVFPSGVKIRGLGPEARCIQCHMGRASTPTLNNAIQDLDITNEDTSNEKLVFINSHSTSGATSFGRLAKGAYEYPEKSYNGIFIRGEESFSCIRCHDPHTLKVQFESCVGCHTISGTEFKDVRVDTTDFDGDGNIQEGIAHEIQTFHDALLLSIQNYAQEIVGTPIAFDQENYPYFFTDLNADGVVNPDEALYENRYSKWTPRLLKAAYNYNYVIHDPGAFAHNSDYTLQVLYDSLSDIGGNISAYARP